MVSAYSWPAAVIIAASAQSYVARACALSSLSFPLASPAQTMRTVPQVVSPYRHLRRTRWRLRHNDTSSVSVQHAMPHTVFTTFADTPSPYPPRTPSPSCTRSTGLFAYLLQSYRNQSPRRRRIEHASGSTPNRSECHTRHRP